MVRGQASDCDDDDAASEASSEALALAVATGEATEEEEAAEAPKEPKFGLTRLGSLLPRRADAGQEGLFGTMLRRMTSCQRHITAFKPVDRVLGRSATLLWRPDLTSHSVPHVLGSHCDTMSGWREGICVQV